MAESMKSLARRGLVSQNAILKATKVQKSKMAPFDGKSKDEGKQKGKPPIGRNNQINRPAVQADHVPGGSMPSRGGGVIGKTQPHRNAIDKALGGQAKKFPAGGNVSAKGKKGVGVKGPAGKSSGGQYGGPSSRAAG